MKGVIIVLLTKRFLSFFKIFFLLTNKLLLNSCSNSSTKLNLLNSMKSVDTHAPTHRRRPCCAATHIWSPLCVWSTFLDFAVRPGGRWPDCAAHPPENKTPAARCARRPPSPAGPALRPAQWKRWLRWGMETVGCRPCCTGWTTNWAPAPLWEPDPGRPSSRDLPCSEAAPGERSCGQRQLQNRCTQMNGF